MLENGNSVWERLGKKLCGIPGIVVMLVFICILFVRTLERTIPDTLPCIDEEKLRMTVAGIYEPAISEADKIVLYETARSRDIDANRDYYEYDYEYIRPGECYGGHLTVCYEYDNRGWRLVSIGITDLKQQEKRE